MPKLKIQNKQTEKTKVFERRDKFISWITTQNPNIPEHDLKTMRLEGLVEKYLSDWFVIFW